MRCEVYLGGDRLLIVHRRCAQMTENDTKLDREGPTLRLLLSILRFEV